MTYTGPAGVILSRDDAFRVWQVLCTVDEHSLNVVRGRLLTYLESDWQDKANTRARALEQWNPQTHNPDA